MKHLFYVFAIIFGSQLLNSTSPQTKIFQPNSWSLRQTLTQGGLWDVSLAVALSADTTTLAVADSGFKYVSIYIWSETEWIPQTTIQVESESVALSADGNTLAIGTPFYGTKNQGATYLYVRTGTTWTQQAILSQGNSSSSSSSSEGSSVALSADGNTLAAGVPYLNNDNGGIDIYVRSGDSWTLQTTLSQNASGASEGSAVALSADGAILAAGAPLYGTGQGATNIYIFDGTTWVFQETVTQLQDDSREGYSVSLSSDGSILATGALGFNNGTGATQIYNQIGTQWLYANTLSQNNTNSNEGGSVALSAKGYLLAAGASYFNQTGATQVYANTGTSWQYQATVTQEFFKSAEGSAVALSSNGTMLIAGAPYTVINSGITLVYGSD
jgi:hypothetical protein